VGQFMKRDADQQIGIDVRREVGAGVVGRRIVGTQTPPPEFQLCVPDRNVGLPLDRRSARQAVERRVAGAGVVHQHLANPRIIS
jgi:hypothetical protein